MRRNIFTAELMAITDEDPTGAFYCADKNGNVCVAQRMDATELLIVQHGLTDWMDPGYPGKDLARKARPLLKVSHQCLMRRQTAQPASQP